MTPSISDPQPAEQEAEPEDYGVGNRDLPNELIEILRSTIQEFQGQEKFTRRREVRRDRRLRFYEAGYQHLQWSNGANGGFTQLMPGGIATNGAGQSIQCPAYMDAYNIFFPYFRIIQSVLTQTLPGVNFKPLDQSSPDDIDKAKAAEKYAYLYDRQNDIKDLMGQIVRMFAMSGRCVTWTRTEEDGQRFGWEADGVTPKKFQRTTVHGTLETKVSISAREFDNDFLYTIIYNDIDIKAARDKYPWIADKIKAGNPAIGENQYERWARLGVLNGSRGQAQIGDTLTHVVTEAHCFLRPAALFGEQYKDDQKDRSQFEQMFPHGARVVFVGDVYAQSFAECMDDHIHIEFPYQGDGMSRQPFMESMAVVQDNFNDLCNWLREKVDTGAGSLWVDGTQEDVDAVTSQRAAPNAIRPWKSPSTGKLQDAFFKEAEVQIPETLFKLLEFLRGQLPEFLLAALPSLQGGEMSDNKTASGYAQANAQAKGQLSIIWARMQRMFARIRYQSVLAASEDEALSGTVQIPGIETGDTISVDLDALKKGNFGCYPDEDSGFPESTAQKRANLDSMIQLAGQSPMVAQLLDNPDNIEEFAELKGFPGLVLVAAEARTKQLFEIQQMLEEAPIPPDPAMVEEAMTMHAAASISARHTGQPEPPAPDPQAMLKPSVPVDELDFHQFEFAKCQEWLSSSDRRDQDRRGNQQGVANVRLHALAHKAMLLQQMAQQAAATAPPPAQTPHKGKAPEAKPQPTAPAQAGAQAA